MVFSELSGILKGSATVSLPETGYLISNENVENLIEFYADREVISISGNCDGSEVFGEQDVLFTGVLAIRLGLSGK